MPYVEKNNHIDAISKDLKAYIYQHFDISAEQRARIISLPCDYFKFLGAYISTMLVSGFDMDFYNEDVQDIEKTGKEKKCKTTIKSEFKYEQGKGFSGTIGGSWTF
jgi:hypothetical protein